MNVVQHVGNDREEYKELRASGILFLKKISNSILFRHPGSRNIALFLFVSTQ